MNKNYGLSYLKLLLTLYVVLHHALLPYLSTAPGVLYNDPNNVEFFGYITMYFDNFFMYTFFFISGIFVYNSLEKHGTFKFLLRNIIKYTTILLLGTYAINIILVYISTSIAYDQSFNFITFYKDLLTFYNYTPSWHLWFIWVLLLFHILSALLHKVYKTIKQSEEINILILSILALPIMIISNYMIGDNLGYDFIQISGPFSIQIYRIVSYYTMYFLGVAVGIKGINNTVLNSKRRTGYALIIMGILLTPILMTSIINITTLWYYALILPSLIALISTFGYVIVFNKLQTKNNLLLTLSSYSLGIYILHYGIQQILTLLLININLSGLIKAPILFILSLILSILLTHIYKVLYNQVKQVRNS